MNSSNSIKLEIKRYQENFREEWEKFVSESNNGTIFHYQQFLAYHPPGRFEDHNLLFFQKGKLLSLLPAVISSRRGEKNPLLP